MIFAIDAHTRERLVTIAPKRKALFYERQVALEVRALAVAVEA
jgi:hypothetical protein